MSIEQRILAKMAVDVERGEAKREFLQHDAAGLEVERLMEQYQTAHPKATAEEALREVLKANPDLAKTYGAATNEAFAQMHPSVDFKVPD